MIKRFTDYKINEMKIPTLNIEEFLANVSPIKDDLYTKALANHFKTYVNYIDVNDKKKHFFKVHDMSGDIMNNNRVSFRAMVFTEDDLKTIHNNIVKSAINEVYSDLPDTLNVYGATIKLISFLDKEALKFSLENIINMDETLKVVTASTGYIYVAKADDFHIWKKDN